MAVMSSLGTSKKSIPSLQEQILDACSGSDVPKLQNLIEAWDEQLLKTAAGSGSIEIVQQLRGRYSTTESLNQIMLGAAAQKCNVEVFKFLLQQGGIAGISDHVRSLALEGGVEIWKAILDYNPELINYDFGEKGDPISMAVLMNNAPLLAFFLDQGLDPNKSRLFSKPIIDVATSKPPVKKEVLDLLVQHGATREKSRAANQAWRNA